MLRDRPGMVPELSNKPQLRQWLERHFAGEDLEMRVRWDAKRPQSEQPAEHVPPARPGEPTLLRVGTDLSGTDQLALAVFELVNMAHAEEFASRWREVEAGTLGRDAFAEQMATIELRAMAEFQALARLHNLQASERAPMLEAMLTWPCDLPSFRRRAKMEGGYDAEAYWRAAWDSRKPRTSAAGGL